MVRHVPEPGRLLARGAARMLSGQGFSCLTEFAPKRGLRADLLALGPKGEVWIVECKSCRADFTSDRKWQGYLPWCDSFFWAVDDAFPDEILPREGGLIRADAYGAEILRWPVPRRLAGARRSALTRAMAHDAARRLQALTDPGARGWAL